MPLHLVLPETTDVSSALWWTGGQAICKVLSCHRHYLMLLIVSVSTDPKTPQSIVSSYIIQLAGILGHVSLPGRSWQDGHFQSFCWVCPFWKKVFCAVIIQPSSGVICKEMPWVTSLGYVPSKMFLNILHFTVTARRNSRLSESFVGFM